MRKQEEIKEINWKLKALIGACGGVCLVITKLLAGTISQEFGGNKLGAGLTLFCLVTLSTIFTCFMEESNRGKLFMQALLAPSFLIAAVTAGDAKNQELGAKGADVNPLKPVPTASPSIQTPERQKIPISQQAPSSKGERPIHAALPLPLTTQAANLFAIAQGGNSNDDLKVETLNERELGSLTDGALAVLGRPQPPKFFIFIVGKTEDENLALGNGRNLKKYLQNFGAKIRLRRPAGSREIYLTIGEFDTYEAAGRVKDRVGERAQTISDVETKNLLSEGKVVDGRTLFR